MTTCGLDFGTSNSTIGLVKAGHNTMVPLEKDEEGQWQTTLPSALFFAVENEQISFGRRAISRYSDGEPGRLLRSMKSVLGSSLMGESTRVGNRFLSYDDIVGFFIASLKEQADEFVASGFEGDVDPLESVVIGRPVYFNDDDPELDRAAENHLAAIARIAGFKEVSFQFEPIAAALDYEKQVIGEELALIIDVGGGTSDFTLIKLSADRHNKSDRQEDFLANHGIHLGGTDFDRQLSVNGIMSEFGLGMPMSDRPNLSMPNFYYYELATWHKIHTLYERDVFQKLKTLRTNVSDSRKIDKLLELLKLRKGHHLAAIVERAKIELSDVEETVVDLESLFADSTDYESENCVMTRDQLDEYLERDVKKIFSTLDETLKRAAVKPAEIHTVFTTGGSTALPLIKQTISAALPEARLVAGDLYNSVGSGLLVEALKRYG